jgi:ribosomal protein L4
LLDGAAFSEASTRTAAELLATWGKELPAVVVATSEEETVWRSFRNLDGVLVCSPSELEVASVAWARALLVTEAALPLVQGRAAGEQLVREGGPEEASR